MTNAPNSSNAPRPNPGLRRLLTRTAIAAGIILVVGIIGGSWLVWLFVNQRLGPIVQDNLTKTLKRPVQLGRVEGFWLNGLRFGPSGVPATPTDPDKASVAAVEVGFNPVDFLLTRTLKLDITLVKPDIFLEQDKEGRWINIALEPKQEPGGLKTQVEVVRVQNAGAVLLPFPKPGNQQLPLKFGQVNGEGKISEEGKRIRFDLAGLAASGGNFRIGGDSRLTTKETALSVRGQDLVAVDISRLLKLPGLDLEAGLLDANLDVQLEGAQPTSFMGTAGLKEVTVQIPQLPQRLTRTNGALLFQGTQIQLDNVTSFYGKIPAIATGIFDTKAGFNIKAATAPITIKTVLDTFNVKPLPVATIGEVKAELQLTGTLSQPVVSGTLVNTKLTRIDRLNIKALNASFGLVGSTLAIKSFQAKPSVGGQIDGSGEAKLGENGGVAIDFQATNLPGDAIARIYNTTPPVSVGKIAAKGQIFGPINNIQTIVRWNAPNAIYPATGEIAIQPNGTIYLRDTNVQVAGGQLNGTGQITGRNWQASIVASGIQGKGLEPLLKRQLPPQLQGAIAGKFNLSGNLDSITSQTIRATGSAGINVAGGTVTASNINLDAGRFTADVTAAGVQLGQLAPQLPSQLRTPVNGTFKVAGNLDNSNSGIQAKGSGSLNVAGGTVTASNFNLREGLFSASVNANNVNVNNFTPQLRGRLNGNFDLAGNLNNLQPAAIQGRGSGSLNVGGGTVTASNINLQGGRFSASVQASSVNVGSLSPQVPPQLQDSRLNGNFNLVGSLDKLSPNTIQGSGSGSLNVGGGTVTASNVTLNAGRFIASVQASDVAVGNLSPQVPPTLRRSRLNGTFDLAGSLNNLQPAAIQGRGAGSINNVGGGTVTASNINLGAGRFSASVQANDVGVASLSPQVPPQLRQGRLNGNFDLAGSLDKLTPEAIRGVGSGRIDNVSGGTVTASKISIDAGRFNADVRTENVALSPFSSQLRGQLNGDLNLSGTLAALTPSAIRASGNVNFSQGISSIEKPLTTAFSWDGQNLNIQRASGPGLEASGVIALARVNGPGTPVVKSFNLNVQAQDLNLQQLPITPPNNLKVAGLLDFTGRLSGTPSDPTVVGSNLRLRNFKLNEFTFEPVLTGSVQLESGKGGNLQLRGNQDRIEVALSPNNQPTSFLLNIAPPERDALPENRIIASGRTQGEQLLVDVQNFPIATLKNLAPSATLASLPPNIASQPISGQLSGNFAVTLGKGGLTTLPDRIIANNVAIAKPIIGNIKGDQITVGSLSYINGILNVDAAQFQQGETKYILSANLNQNAKPQPQFQANVKVAKGKVQDILATASIYNIQDLIRGVGNPPTYGKAADVQPLAIGNPQDTVQTQLRRLSEILALRDRQQRQREANPIPELRDLAGTFDGEVKIAGSLKQNFAPNFDSLNVNFNINGNDWKWERYTANQVIVRGSFQNGVLTLLPLRIESDKSLVAFSGSIGGDQQTGQLRVRNLPIDALSSFVDLPVDLSGSLSGRATLAGSIQNPLARGELTLSEGTLNGANVESAQGSFSYANARLNFGSTLVVAMEAVPGKNPGPNPQSPVPNSPTTPISVNGSIPYKLPFASVKPDNNQFAINANVQNQGLALLNVLTRRQVSWVNGSGQVDLQIQGTLEPNTERIQQLVARGSAKVENATVKAQALPDVLTGVNATALFNLDRIQVDSFQANYGKGIIQLVEPGVLPISPSLNTDNGLKVNIGELALNLKGLYTGGVRGNIQVNGAALAPKVSGKVELFNGSVQVPTETSTLEATGGGNVGGGGATPQAAAFSIALDNLTLSLGKNVQVTQAPILNFLATGDLIVNGSLDDITNLRPSGKITLQRGQVNVFTTQFRLDKGYPQTAEFVPSQGLIPNLDVRLFASVAEVTRSRLPKSNVSSEINDDLSATNLGALGTVRILAKVQGPANRLNENLQLTSNPSRSESEIVGLLGGGFVETLGRGDSTLGIANFAGTALLGNVQNVIGDALGLSEFRLFPTVKNNNTRNARGSASTLGLAAEVGVDITSRFSASASKILTSEEAAQFGLRYRLNDKILLRGSTDLSGDNRAVVEYEKRF